MSQVLAPRSALPLLALVLAASCNDSAADGDIAVPSGREVTLIESEMLDALARKA